MRSPTRHIFATLAMLSLVVAPASADVPGRALFHSTTAPLSSREIGGPPPGTHGLAANDCGDCHREIAREWRSSQHAASWTDPVVVAGYAVEPRAFCRNCHAPLAPSATEPGGLAARDGISCTVCHVREGRVLGVGRGSGDARRGETNEPESHTTVAQSSFADSTFCAGCHQFDFRRRREEASLPREAMQNTFAEWQASDAAARGTSCQDCHMPWREESDGRRWRSHVFAGASDPSMLARAVRVEVTRRRVDGNDALVATFSPGDIGHAFPTGDVFRRLELRAWREGEPPAITSLAREFCDRFEPDEHGAPHLIRRACSDTRIPAPRPGATAPTVIELRLGASSDPRAAIHWALDYRRLDAARTASESLDEAMVTTRIAGGTLPP